MLLAQFRFMDERVAKSEVHFYKKNQYVAAQPGAAASLLMFK